MNTPVNTPLSSIPEQQLDPHYLPMKLDSLAALAHAANDYKVLRAFITATGAIPPSNHPAVTLTCSSYQASISGLKTLQVAVPLAVINNALLSRLEDLHSFLCMHGIDTSIASDKS